MSDGDSAQPVEEGTEKLSLPSGGALLAHLVKGNEGSRPGEVTVSLSVEQSEREGRVSVLGLEYRWRHNRIAVTLARRRFNRLRAFVKRIWRWLGSIAQLMVFRKRASSDSRSAG